MLHEPATPAGKDPAFAYKRRLGVILFFVYAAIYAAFVILNLVTPSIMDTTLFAGLNVAVIYGFGLILLALILALAYNRACGKKEAALALPQKEGR
jgi:uncharacterized membrane protein (DUF485 family)